MPWQVATVFYVVLSSFRAILNRRVGSHKTDLTLYALVASFTSVGIVALLIGILNINDLNHQLVVDNLPRLIAGGVMFGVINLLMIKLFRLISASIAVFLNLFNVITTTVIASLFLNERITAQQWSGAVFLAFSVLLVAYIAEATSTKKKTNKRFLKGLLTALTASMIFGPAVVNERYLIDNMGLNTYIVYGWGLQCLFAFLIAYILRDKNKKKRISTRMHKDVWLYGSMLGIAGFAYVNSVSSANSVSLPTISSTARVAITMILAYWVLRERDYMPLKIFGLGLSMIGLFLIFN